jgi:hypothetical protein
MYQETWLCPNMLLADLTHVFRISSIEKLNSLPAEGLEEYNTL